MRVSTLCVLLLSALFAACVSAALPTFVGNNNAFLTANQLDTPTELLIEVGQLPAGVSAIGATLHVTFPAAADYAIEFNAYNSTTVVDADGVDLEFSYANNVMQIAVPLSATAGTLITVTNVQFDTASTSIMSSIAVFNGNDVKIVEDVLLFYPVGVQVFGSLRSQVTPFNVTKGSDFGLITLAVSPLTVGIPKFGALSFSIPSSWTIASMFSCKASINIVNPAKADMLVSSSSSGKVITVSFTDNVIAASTTDTLRVFCYDAVKVAAVAETYPGQYSTVLALDASLNPIMEALRVPFPDILSSAPPKKMVGQDSTMKRAALMSTAEQAAFRLAYASGSGVPAEYLTLRGQKAVAAFIAAQETASRAGVRVQFKPLEGGAVDISMTADVSPDTTLEDTMATLNNKRGAVASQLKNALGVEFEVKEATIVEEDASCSNGVQDNAETDVDCGGSTCMACALNKKCVTNNDCITQKCSSKGVCVASTSAAADVRGSAVVAALVAAVAVIAMLF